MFRAHEDFEQAPEIRLELKLVNVTPRDQFELRLNGEPVQDDRVRRLHAPNGRDVRLHAETLGPYSLYLIDLNAAALRRGENRLTVSLVERELDLLGEIEVREVELSVRYSDG